VKELGELLGLEPTSLIRWYRLLYDGSWIFKNLY